MDSAFRCCEGLRGGVDVVVLGKYDFLIFYDGVGFYGMAVFEKWLRNSHVGAQCEEMRKVKYIKHNMSHKTNI